MVTTADLLLSSISCSFYKDNSAKIQHVRPYAPLSGKSFTVYRLRYNFTQNSQTVRERVDQIWSINSVSIAAQSLNS